MRWQVGNLQTPKEDPWAIQAASLREDYLNQVQRDFLSRHLPMATPLAACRTVATSAAILRHGRHPGTRGGLGIGRFH